MKKVFDNQGRPYAPGINCSKCGRWVGKDGDCGLSLDYEYGWDIYYPTCGPCTQPEALADVYKDEER